MAGFWVAFLPNVAATLVGVLVGVPLALLINRRAVLHGEAARAVAEKARVADALEVVSKALTYNATPLETLVQTLEQGKAQLDLPLDTSAWGAVKADVSGIVEPELRRRLAFHFSRLEALVELNSMFLTFVTGTNASMKCRRDEGQAEASAYRIGPSPTS